jgi:hypothetical protein
MWLSNDPLANMCWFSGEGERLDINPSWPLRVVIVIAWARGSCRRILLLVVPSARREREDSEIRDRRGAVKGVEDIVCDDAVNRS